MNKIKTQCLRHSVCVCIYLLCFSSPVSGYATTSMNCLGVGKTGQSTTLVCTLSGTVEQGIFFIRPNSETVVACNSANTGCRSSIAGYTAVINSNTQITLTINSFNSAHDAGTWTCQDENTGVGSSTCNKRVASGPDSLTFSPSSGEVREGGDLTVRCSAQCIPACTYSWKEGDREISSNSDLTLTDIRRDLTQVTCTATNNLIPKSINRDFQLTVYYGPDNVHLNVSSATVTIQEGDDLAVSCSSTCFKSCSYTWKFKTQTYNSAVLSLTDVRKSNAGVYTCTAVNTWDQRSADTKFSLNVQYQASIKSLTFNSQFSSVTVAELTRVTLSCDVDSNPASHIKLYNNSHIMYQVYNSKRTEYMWNEAECLATGRYTCEANNKIKSAVNQSVQLIVTCSPRLDHRVTFEDKLATTVGGDVTLSISVIVNPAPTFTWYRLTDKKIKLITSDPVSTTDVSAVGSYTITNVQEKDLGRYQVVVTNSAPVSNLVKNFTVVAQEPPTIPSDVIVWKTGPYSIYVSWIEEFNGGLTQTFLVQYRDEHTTEWKNLTQQFTQTGLKSNHTAEISNLQPNTRYLVRVLAYNSEGNKGFTAEQETLTDESTCEKDSSLGAGIGIGIGIMLVIVLLVAGLIFTYSRMKTAKSSAENTYDSRQFQAEVQESSLYDDLGQTQGNAGNVSTNVSTNVSDSYSTLETRKETPYEVLAIYENSQIKQVSS